MDAAKVTVRFLVGLVPVLGALYIGVGVRFMRRGDRKISGTYPLLMFACAAYAFAYYLEVQASDIGLKLAARCAATASFLLIPTLSILFIYGLAKGKKAPLMLKAALFALSAGLWVLFLFNPCGLYYDAASLSQRGIGGYTVLYYHRGPMYAAVYGYYTALLLYTAVSLHHSVRAARKPGERRRLQRLLFFSLTPLPCLAWLFLGLDRLIDPSPIFLLFLGSLSLLSEGKSDMLRVQVRRWEEMFQNTGDPALLVRDQDVVCMNAAALGLPGIRQMEEGALLPHLGDAMDRREPAGFPQDRPERWLDVRQGYFDMRRGLVYYQLIDVTDKYRQHQQLQASQERYSLLIAQMQQGLAVFSAEPEADPAEYACMHGNEAFALSVGVICADKLPGLTMGKLFPILDEQWREALHKAAQGGEVPRFERYWPQKDRYFGIRIYTPLPGQVAVILSDITARKSIEQQLTQKDRLLVAIIGVTQDLLKAGEFRQAACKALALVGEALQVSRGYLFEGLYEGEALRGIGRLADWCDVNLPRQTEILFPPKAPLEAMDQFLPPLQEGRPFAAHVSQLPQSRTKELLRRQQVRSLLALPILVEGRFWGFVGFDESRSRREWTQMEQDVLRLFADSLGRAIERNTNEMKLREAQERNEAMLRAIPDLFFIITPEGRVTHYHASNGVRNLYAPPEEFLNRLVTESLPPAVGTVMLKQIQGALTRNAIQIFEYALEIGGDLRHYEGRVMPINRESVLLLARDITERKRRLERIEYLSYHDQLTGLYNRRSYTQQAEQLDRRGNLPLALIMADMNGLKLTNDAFGHQSGDLLLTGTAAVLRRICGEEAVFRVGGDEFVVLLPHTGAAQAEAAALRIRREVAAESAGKLIFSVAVGHAVKELPGELLDEVFRQAEDNMYQQKLSEASELRRRFIQMILDTLYERSPREMQHSKQVGELCRRTAQALGLSPQAIQEAYLAGAMHDIGKIGIDQAILEKNARLDESELKEMRRHCEVGYRILSSAQAYASIAQYVLEHHERWDGAGYPKGIPARDTALISRIIAVADGYDAMASPRVYKQAMAPREALRELSRCAGSQYDPQVVDVFVNKVMGGADSPD